VDDKAVLRNLERLNLGDAVLKELQRAISCGVWEPGSKIPPETELARMLGVSRVTVRGAIQKLSSLGILESKQGEGTYVRAFNGSQLINAILPSIMLQNDQIAYVLEFRSVIECECAALAALRATEDDIILRLKENVSKMQHVDPFSEECSVLDIDFHMQIAKLTGNPILVQIMLIFKEYIFDFIRKTAHRMKENNALYYHPLIIAAIEEHNDVKASETMNEHLSTTREILNLNVVCNQSSAS
jgi:GntR family transcriptional repressor for pyruvate dehydrogenase complex